MGKNTISTPRVAILAASEIERDPRIRRQIDALCSQFHVTVFGFGQPHRPDVHAQPLRDHRSSVLRKANLKAFAFAGFPAASLRFLPFSLPMKTANEVPFDVVLANDPETLPIAWHLAQQNRSALVFDAHEYSPGQFTGRLSWELTSKRIALHLLKRYLPEVDVMTTVNDVIADAYHRDFGLEPTVITNAGNLHSLEPSIVAENRIRLIYHGGVNPSRQLERMLDAFLLLDGRFELDMMLVETGSRYAKGLTGRIHSMERVSLVDPVSFDQIVPFTNQYDVGIYLLPPTTFNTTNALPNKFFEYIQARLAIAIGPTPTMSSFMERYGCGVVSENFSPASFAQTLNALTAEKVTSLKKASHQAARHLNAEKNQEIWQQIVETAIRKRQGNHG